MKNKLTHFTRLEGGMIIPANFDFYEEQVETIGIKDIIKKEVFSKTFKYKIFTRVAKINKIWVHALFFEDGKVYNATPSGFKLRQIEKEIVL